MIGYKYIPNNTATKHLYWKTHSSINGTCQDLENTLFLVFSLLVC